LIGKSISATAAKQGRVLATIDIPDLDAQLDAAKAKLSASQADIKLKQADVDFARSSYDRQRDSPRGVISDQGREEKKATNDIGVAKLNAAVDFRNVSIASDDGGFVDLAAGMNIGEDVALNINSQISDGDKVVINNPSKAKS